MSERKRAHFRKGTECNTCGEHLVRLPDLNTGLDDMREADVCRAAKLREADWLRKVAFAACLRALTLCEDNLDKAGLFWARTAFGIKAARKAVAKAKGAKHA